MPAYDERLSVPWWWWPVSAGCVALLGAEIHIGLGWVVAVATYGVLGMFVAALFLTWGSARVRVVGDELWAGRARLPLSVVGRVVTVSPAQARALRGGAGDPAAYVFARPYLTRAVFVELRDPQDPTPYWLIFTRHPEKLAAAVSARHAGSGTGAGTPS